jgi:hypothetical protein
MARRDAKFVLLALAAAIVAWLLWRRHNRVVDYEGYTDEENDAWLQERLTELHAHLAEVDPELADLAATVKDVRLLRDPNPRTLPNGKIGYNSGKFKHSTGVMWVGGRDGHLRERTRGAMLMTLLHEIAHAGIGPTNLAEGTPHGEEWKEVWTRLLKHATGHLKWDVEVRCAECTYYNLCSQKQCPGCKWMQTTCAPYAGGSPSDFRKKAQYQQ